MTGEIIIQRRIIDDETGLPTATIGLYLGLTDKLLGTLPEGAKKITILLKKGLSAKEQYNLRHKKRAQLAEIGITPETIRAQDEESLAAYPWLYLDHTDREMEDE